MNQPPKTIQIRTHQHVWRAKLASLKANLLGLRFSYRTVPVALLGIIFLAFGLLIPWLGFYQDDWQEVWFAHSFGLRVFIPFYANERPFNAGIHMLTHFLAGDVAWHWHILALVARWLSALAIWWCLRVLWPKNLAQVTWVAALYAVYPSFREHSLAVAYSPYYLLMAMEFVSFGAMLLAIRYPKRKVPLTLLGLATAAVPLFSIEHLFPLEFFRPLLIWSLLLETGGNRKQRLRRTIQHWLPYLILVALFLYWRLFIFGFVTYEPGLVERLAADPRMTMIELVQTVVQDGLEVAFFAWTQTLDFVRTISPSLRPYLVHWGLVLTSAALAGLYLSKLSKLSDESLENNTWSKQAILIGSFSFVFSGWPAWFTHLPIGLDISADRFTLVYMPTISLLLVGLVDYFLKNRAQKAWLLGIMIGLAIGFQFETADMFRSIQQEQKDVFQEMVWRAPGLQPNTLILSNPFPINLTSSGLLTIPVNWIYDDQPQYPQLHYMLFYISERLGGDLPGLESGLPVEKRYRSTTYRGSTDQAVVISYLPPACLLLVDPQVYGSTPRLAPEVQAAMQLTKPSQVLPEASGPARRLSGIFGSQPKADWCYYFEKADLARQQGDWQSVVQFSEDGLALTAGPSKKSLWELLPLIEAYPHNGEWSSAIKVTNNTLSAMPGMERALCQTWDRIEMNTEDTIEKTEALQKIRQMINCEPAE